MTTLPKKIDPDTADESPSAGNAGRDSTEDQCIRELLEEGLASGPPLPVDSDFFERLRARAGKRS